MERTTYISKGLNQMMFLVEVEELRKAWKWTLVMIVVKVEATHRKKVMMGRKWTR
jgi:hypothetical protein